MVKKLNDIKPMPDDDNDQPELDMSKPLGVQANARTFGTVDMPDEEREVIKPIALDKITPDPVQPRREIPKTVRKQARADNAPAWQVWHRMAQHEIGYEIPLPSLLRGEIDLPDKPKDEKTGKDKITPLFDGFMDLVALAASIYQKGLVNPITISARGPDQYKIETGERRYQAYWMLNGVLKEKKFNRIKANIVGHVNIWRQAAENGSRKRLNAIAMARQVSLLMMEIFKDNGETFNPYEYYGEERDREFFAQVADGDIHRLPKGSMARIMQATGLQSKQRIQQYRALLSVTNEIWDQADEENWYESAIQETLKPQDRSKIFDLSDGQPSALNRDGHIVAANGPAIYPLEGDGVRYMAYRSHRVKLERFYKNAKGILEARIWHLKGESDDHEYAVPVPMSDLIPLEYGTPATGERGIYRGEEVEWVDYTSRTHGPVDVLIWHLNAQGLRMKTRTVRMSELEPIDHPERGKPTPTGGWPQSRPVPAPAPRMPEIKVGQTYRTVADRYMKVARIVGDSAICDEVRADGSYMKGAPFNIPFSDMAKLSLVAMPGVFDKDAAQAAIMEDEPENQAEDNPSSMKPELPAWAVEGMSVESMSGKRGVITSVQFNEGLWQWVAVILNKFGEAPYSIKDLMPIGPMPEAAQQPDPVIDESGLPAWAKMGATVKHRDTGKICDVVGTGRDDVNNVWMLRVVLRGETKQHDIAVSEFDPYTEAYTPHPALKNRTGVITEDQRKIGHLASLAAMLGHKEDEAMLRIVPVLVPNHILEWINTDGLQSTEDRLIGIFTTGEQNLLEARDILRAEIEEALIVARALDDDQRRKKQAS